MLKKVSLILFLSFILKINLTFLSFFYSNNNKTCAIFFYI